MSTDEPTITFRPLALTDMNAMSRWLGDPDVARWYTEDGTDVGYLTNHYRDSIEGREATRGFIMQVGGEEIGYIQAVPIDGYPDYARQLQLEPGTVGIDLFIGEQAWRGRGIGTRVLATFTQEIVFGQMRAPVAVIGPSPDNARAIRSYEKAGFRWIKTVPVVDKERPYENGDEYLMGQVPTSTPNVAICDQCQR
jgi:aminoglycoside 6'-N-acetyltransferase